MRMSNANLLFDDTSGWADPILQNTTEHQAMMAFARQLTPSGRKLVTTNYVITELVALLTARAHSMSRTDLIQFTNRMLANPRIQVVHVDPATHAEAWVLLEHSLDKEWSLVDASSFIIMRQMGITEAFTSDHHFVQAGFIRVPQGS